MKPVVTIAALHGTDGGDVAPRIAEHLGVAFLDRAISASVARAAGVHPEVVEAVGAREEREARWPSVLARATNAVTASGHGVEEADADERRIRNEVERFLTEASRSGGVVLGRGAAVILADAPGALHVHLGGPHAARVERVMERDGLDRRAAQRSVDRHDRARRAYVRGAYGADGDAPSLYHLMLDATRLGPDLCVALVVDAARTLADRRVGS